MAVGEGVGGWESEGEEGDEVGEGVWGDDCVSFGGAGVEDWGACGYRGSVIKPAVTY